MSSASQPSPPRAGSYILVPSSAPLDDSPALPDVAQRASASRPRLFFLLPLVAVLDIATTVTLGILVLRQQAKHNEPETHTPRDLSSHDPVMTSAVHDHSNAGLDKGAWERRKIVLLVVAFSIARACAFAIVGISRRVRQLGVTVAAISILSALFYVSVANLLFQARSKPDTLETAPFSWSSLFASDEWRWPDAFRHFEPTMPILIGAQMAFTLFEWILYIAIVGVKIPPGGNPVEAKRWARNLADDPYFQRGVDAHSLYPSEDGREAEQDEYDANDRDFAASSGAGEEADVHTDADVEQARTLLASPILNLSRKEQVDGSDQSLLGAGPSTPRGYGSTLSDPRTPQGTSQPHHQQGSVRSARSPAAAGPASARGLSRSASARSDLYSRSPGAAELGEVIDDDDDEEDDERDGEGDEEAEGSDPDDIIDITPNRAVARKEARLRLARAALPERRASGGTLSTLSIFGGGGGGSSSSGDASSSRIAGGPRGANVFSNEAGSPLGRNTREDQLPAALLSVTRAPETSRRASLAADTSIQSSNSMTLPSSSSTHTASTKASSLKDRKFKLPKWMKPNSKSRKK
ncbi:uncharacterized protein SPSC_03786 [Sporisorium scitamineum]|uniref:Uncharacterized protein n=1 Tax=Sporisorium scitamineum TaxID=49012 RepID=A0A0F7S8S5_9BASI|nr:uncharacterized protein SPSC_03786 [Sporisorium scitamineum]CDW97320.1 hypothetical protein [Sporisorium scitamineum]